MTTKVSYKAMYNRQKELDRNGLSQVIIRAYQNPIRRYFSTGIRIAPHEWDERNNQIKKRPEYNSLIRRKIEELENFELMFPVHHNRPFNIKDFDLLVKPPKVEEAASPSFTDFAFEQIGRDVEKKSLGYKTAGRHKLTLNRLAEFAGVKNLTFTDITYSLIEGFDHYMATVGFPNKKGRLVTLKTNTIHKCHQYIHKYLLRAVKKGLLAIQNDPYNDFELEKVDTEAAVLQPEDIKALAELPLNEGNKHLELDRDAFLLGYYTLLRISDITKIKMEKITETKDGLILEVKETKTDKLNRINLYELHPTENGPSKPEQIIRKYWRQDQKALLKKSHQKINENLKELMRLAKIKKHKPITFHTSRHSGITFLAKQLPVATVQKLAQHSNIATTMRYVHIARKDVSDSLSQVNWN